MNNIKTKILGTGIYLPKQIVTNFDLEKIVDTSDQWIYERTGIKQRRISSKEGGEYPSDMGKFAAEEAIKNAGINKNDIDMIILTTATPDMPIPNTASILQTKLGITNHCACMDLLAACSGFVYGLTVADSLIKNQQAKNVLVAASEMLSSSTNWQDRNSCILFGDGCGAAVIGITPNEEESDIFASKLSADGTGREFLDQPAGGSVTPITADILLKREQYIQMKGRDMFKVATRTLADVARHTLDKANISVESVDWLIPHQANIRIINKTVELLQFDPSKVIINIENYGNTSSATIPIAFHEAITAGKIKRGDTVVFVAFGAGLTSGATVFKY